MNGRNLLITYCLLLNIVIANGQKSIPVSCEPWIILKTDSVSKNKIFAAKNDLKISHGNTAISLYSFLHSSGKVVILSVQAIGAGKCIDKGDKVNIVFTDNTNLDVVNTNDFNCDGSSTLYFGGAYGRKDALRQLTSKNIKTMRVWTRSESLELELTEQEASSFRQTLYCLSASTN